MGKVDSKKRSESNAMKRKLLEERAIYICCNCGKKLTKEEVQVHHVVPLSLGGTNRESNMVIICLECHSKIHGRNLTSGELIKKGIEASNKKSGRKHGKLDKMTKELREDIKEFLTNRSIKQIDLMNKHNISRNTLKKYIKIVKQEVEEGQ